MNPQGFLDSAGQCHVVNFAGKMYRALAMNRIPSCRICDTVKLGIKPYPSGSNFDGQPNHPFCRFPGCTTRCAAYNADRG